MLCVLLAYYLPWKRRGERGKEEEEEDPLGASKCNQDLPALSFQQQQQRTILIQRGLLPSISLSLMMTTTMSLYLKEKKGRGINKPGAIHYGGTFTGPFVVIDGDRVDSHVPFLFCL